MHLTICTEPKEKEIISVLTCICDLWEGNFERMKLHQIYTVPEICGQSN